jgi:hypothetical protein
MPDLPPRLTGPQRSDSYWLLVLPLAVFIAAVLYVAFS